MKASRNLRAMAVTLLAMIVSIPAFAAIEGTVTNGTINRPSAGDEVVLLELSQGMNEKARVKTDASGHYRFDVESGGGGPHLVRVNHQNVNYFKMVPPGMMTGDITVYESANKVNGLTYNIETAFQGNAGTLQVVQFYVVRNQSQPAKTQAGSGGFEIAIPENANVQSADAQAPGGQPVQTVPVPKGKGRYAFEYPLRPGDTTFRIMYELPYSGDMAFKPTLLYPVEQYAIITPQSMSFKANNSGTFRDQPHQGGINVAIANNIPANSDVSYRISGTGQMPETNNADAGSGGMGGGEVQGNGRGPGGGLGNPINTPDPLTKYKWPLLFGFAAILVMGAFYIVKTRQPGPDAPTPAEETADESDIVAMPTRQAALQTTASQNGSSLLLEGLKEELFHLEVERQRGLISQEEYTKTKSAFDATLKRALSRQTREAAS